MAWTSPMTFVANNVLTAPQLNTHLRDNLLELAPAKASSNLGTWFVSQGPNRIEERLIRSARVNTVGTTKSSDYTDLPTYGPKVTVETGDRVIILLQASMANSAGDTACAMGFSIKGRTEKDPSDSYSLFMTPRTANQFMQWGVTYLVENLTPGEHTFTCKYKTGSDTASFDSRFIGVICL